MLLLEHIKARVKPWDELIHFRGLLHARSQISSLLLLSLHMLHSVALIANNSIVGLLHKWHGGVNFVISLRFLLLDLITQWWKVGVFSHMLIADDIQWRSISAHVGLCEQYRWIRLCTRVDRKPDLRAFQSCEPSATNGRFLLLDFPC